MSCCPQTRNTLKTRICRQENTQPIPWCSITRLPAASLSTVTTSAFASEVEGAASTWLPGSLVRSEPTSAPSSSYPIHQSPLPKLPGLPRTRCTFSNRHTHTHTHTLVTTICFSLVAKNINLAFSSYLKSTRRPPSSGPWATAPARSSPSS